MSRTPWPPRAMGWGVLSIESVRESATATNMNPYRRSGELRVLLTKDVENVGRAGDVREVADGYGRNFLLRRKLAVAAGKGAEAEAKRLRDAASKKETKERTEAQTVADEIDNKTVVVRLKVGAEDIYRENNGQIFRAALDLFAAGEPIYNVTLASQLQTMGLLDRVGGRAQLASMQSAVPTAANIEYYGRIVKEKAYKRRLISAGG